MIMAEEEKMGLEDILLMQMLTKKPNRKWIVLVIILAAIGLFGLYQFYPPFREMIDKVNPFIDKIYLYTAMRGMYLSHGETTVCEKEGCVQPIISSGDCSTPFKLKVRITTPSRNIYWLEKEVEERYDCGGAGPAGTYTTFVITTAEKGLYEFKIDLYMWPLLGPIIGWQWMDGKTVTYTAT